MNSLCFNGGLIAKHKGSIALTLYSTPFARFLLEKGINKINLKFCNGKFIVGLGEDRNVTVQRQSHNHPLCIFSVTKLIPSELKKNLFFSNKQLKVDVIVEDIVSGEDLRKYNHSLTSILPDPSIKSIPENEKVDVGCLISCSRTKNSFGYTFKVRHKILEEIALKHKKVILGRNTNGNFIIRKNDQGKEFHLYKYASGTPVAYMQISSQFITDSEKKLFKSGKRCISYRAFLSEKDFNLDISRFFTYREERELAYALLKKGAPIKIPRMRLREADIILRENNAQIEVTNVLPREGENKNNPHGEGMHINGRLCEGFLRAVKKEVPIYFVVFNKKWLSLNWVRQLVEQVKPNVVAIGTDFEKGWEDEVSDKIIKTQKSALNDRI
ncbi:MAG: hypothetical protein PHD95_05935 [Candidatus ainarchaeum sp.]|nr:hypothetical protein [Candidatus ainarchaeum sp.]